MRQGTEKTPFNQIGKGAVAEDGGLSQGQLQNLWGPGQSGNAGPLARTSLRLSRWQQQNLSQTWAPYAWAPCDCRARHVRDRPCLRGSQKPLTYFPNGRADVAGTG